MVIIFCYLRILYLLRAHRETMAATLRYKSDMDDERGIANDTFVEDEFDGGSARTSDAKDPATVSTITLPPSPSNEDVSQNGNDPLGNTESPSPLSQDNSPSNQNQNSSNSNGQTGSSPPVTISTLAREHKSAMSEQQLKITLNLFIVVCVYTLCVMPSAIALLIPSSDLVIPWLTVLLLFNTCANPIIYALKHPTFSQVFGCILKCRYREIQEPSHFLKSTFCYNQHYTV